MKKHLTRARGALDGRLSPMRPTDRFTVPPKGWIRAIRDAIGMSGAQLAAKLGMKPPSVVALEQSEAAATIRLETLQKAAAALDCELVYALVPRKPLEEIVQDRARMIALRELGGIAHSMGLEDQAVPDELEERINRFIEQSLRDRDLWDE